MVVLASVVALAPEVNVSDKWHMLLLAASMSLLMPGQYTHCLALYWHLDVPKCP